MTEMNRREAVGLLALAPLAALAWSGAEVERAATLARDALDAALASGATFAPRFFTPHEWQTVRLLADLVIPRDDRSGSATDAGVPEFMDFMMMDRTRLQKRYRGGLEWLDAESTRRFGKSFVDSAPAERVALLNDIAWPKKARAEMKDGVAFFNGFRDLTASGFWSSRMGIKDLQYIGNVTVMEWKGCPEPALRKLGVSYPAGPG
ncbi:MAG: gluconate 2-dehydrogenase subunit 3 family protein [Gemmatimonadota bacterium]|nr:gluconate 2-dehydrogenase subunit 3 family protein [Gemmatimonadota bacterium]